jgi:hypothetical protein
VTVFIPYGSRDAGPVDSAAGTEAGSTPGEISGAEAQPVLATTGPLPLVAAAREADHRA